MTEIYSPIDWIETEANKIVQPLNPIIVMILFKKICSKWTWIAVTVQLLETYLFDRQPMVVSGSGIWWRQPNHWMKLVRFLLEKTQTVYDLSLETNRHLPKHSPFGDKKLIHSVLYQTNKTLRDVSILRRWRRGLQWKLKASLSSYHSSEPPDCVPLIKVTWFLWGYV